MSDRDEQTPSPTGPKNNTFGSIALLTTNLMKRAKSTASATAAAAAQEETHTHIKWPHMAGLSLHRTGPITKPRLDLGTIDATDAYFGRSGSFSHSESSGDAEMFTSAEHAMPEDEEVVQPAGLRVRRGDSTDSTEASDIQPSNVTELSALLKRTEETLAEDSQKSLPQFQVQQDTLSRGRPTTVPQRQMDLNNIPEVGIINASPPVTAPISRQPTRGEGRQSIDFASGVNPGLQPFSAYKPRSTSPAPSHASAEPWLGHSIMGGNFNGSPQFNNQPLQERINFIKLEEYMEGVNLARKTAATEEPYPRTDVRINITGEPKSFSKISFYSTETGPIVASSLAELGSPEGSGGNPAEPLTGLLKIPTFWIDVCMPGDLDMKVFASIFNIHPLTTEDILTESTREKFEIYKSYYFICYCAFDQDPNSDTYLQSFNVYILVYADFVLSFHFLPLKSVEHVTRRLENLKNYLQVTPHWINYALLDDITDKFLPLIHSLELEVDSIDDLVLVISQTEQSDMLRRIANARKRVLTLQRLLSAKADVLRILIKRLDGMTISNGKTPVDESYVAMIRDTSLYLGDVQDHVITMVQTLLHVDTTLTRCHSNYLAQISIEITQSSIKANESVTKLTALASILVPLNIITGIWGMNVHVPGQLGSEETYTWFTGLITTMIFIVLCGLAWMYKNGLFTKGANRRKDKLL